MLKKRKTVNDFERSSQIYFKEIGGFKTLSKDEEFSLWEKYRKYNDITARDKLIQSNLKFVASVAKSYQGLGLSYSDLIAEGNYGLMKAIDKFDYEKGYKTISYSVWWIKQSILEALKERVGIEGDPLPQDCEKQCSDDEIINNSYNSYNNYFIDDEDIDHEQIEQKRIISILMEGLTKREIFIVKNYYGLDSNKSLTLEEIGKELNLTKERVRQILEKVFKKMRSDALKLNVSDYL
jgi:RNA polymerase primary sigma factor